MKILLIIASALLLTACFSEDQRAETPVNISVLQSSMTILTT
jgi:uncharacterized lipoprotein YajG